MSERGGVPLAFLILMGLALLLLAGMAVCSDALFEDEAERDDLGAPAWVVARHVEDEEPAT